MKLNISNPTTGQNLPLVVDDEKKLLAFFGKRMGQEVDADILGENWAGYILKITGGNDKDGFPMKQGIPLQGRTRLLMSEGHSTYRPRRTGERKKKSVRGCIVGSDLAVLALSVVKIGTAPIEGLTNDKKPRRKGPKRATRVRKLFALEKKEDPRRYVLLYSRKIEKNGKIHWKTPRIQRLVTPERLRRKRLVLAARKGYKAAGKAERDYIKLIADVNKRNINKKAHEIGEAKKAERIAKGLPAVPEKKKAKKGSKKPETKAPTKQTTQQTKPQTGGKTTGTKPQTGTQPKPQTGTQPKPAATGTKKGGK
jgi:small subunit ribosomal protein S6e